MSAAVFVPSTTHLHCRVSYLTGTCGQTPLFLLYNMRSVLYILASSYLIKQQRFLVPFFSCKYCCKL